jgi:hypothetical protein
VINSVVLTETAFYAIPQITWSADADSDGFGDALVSVMNSTQPAGYVLDNTDCDDTDFLVYLGAPGTAEGFDNNCNGSIDPDEASSCVGDFNGDGNVDTADLLLFLGMFGCPSNCAYGDLSGNGSVDTQDLLLFLSIFGTACDL